MKKILLFILTAMMLISLAACTGKGNSTSGEDSSKPAVSSDGASTSGTAGSKDENKLIVKMADGTEKEAVLKDGFYSFATSKLVKIKEIEYQKNKPETGFAQLKLVLEGNKEQTIAFMLKKSVPHGDYATAWENTEYTAYADILTDGNLFGVNSEWQMPENLSDYEIRVFDNKTADNPIEIGFINFESENL